MAQIEQSDGGKKKKKGAQKKMSIHVDFTPMVDMNMLLITFFMLCTTMIKSQTLQIALPTNEKIENEDQKNEAKESEAITMIIDTERDENGNIKMDAEGRPVNNIYYFFGIADENKDGQADVEKLQFEQFLGNDETGQRGIRKILHDRNKDVLAKIDELKVDWRERKFDPNNKDRNDSIYQAKAKEIRNDSTLTRPVVVIKPTANASWESLITALDEMNINQIARYQIENMNALDSVFLEAGKAKRK